MSVRRFLLGLFHIWRITDVINGLVPIRYLAISWRVITSTWYFFRRVIPTQYIGIQR